jgi:hypothetical protein
MGSKARPRRSGAVALGAAFLIGVAATTAGCATGPDETEYDSGDQAQEADDDDYVYCVRVPEGTDEGEVVDTEECESYVHNGGYYPYFFWIMSGHGHSSHVKGHKLKGPKSKAAYNDPTARRSIGVPEKGPVANGNTRSSGFGTRTSTTTKSGTGTTAGGGTTGGTTGSTTTSGGGGFGGTGGGKSGAS